VHRARHHSPWVCEVGYCLGIPGNSGYTSGFSGLGIPETPDNYPETPDIMSGESGVKPGVSGDWFFIFIISAKTCRLPNKSRKNDKNTKFTVLPHCYNHTLRRLSLTGISAKTQSPSNSQVTATFQLLPSHHPAPPSLSELDRIVAAWPASMSHFQQKRTEIFQADVLHVSCGFDDDKIQLVKWSTGDRSSLPNPIWTFLMIARFQNASCGHDSCKGYLWQDSGLLGQVNWYVSDLGKNSL